MTVVNFYISGYFWFLWGRWSLPFTWCPEGEGSVRMNYAICFTIAHDILLIKGERVRDQMLQVVIACPRLYFHLMHDVVEPKALIKCDQRGKHKWIPQKKYLSSFFSPSLLIFPFPILIFCCDFPLVFNFLHHIFPPIGMFCFKLDWELPLIYSFHLKCRRGQIFPQGA